jgi:hypothetical protein
MSRLKCAVCLLALAGGAVWYFWFAGTYHQSPRHRKVPPGLISRLRGSFSVPVTFEPNLGQARTGAQFIGRAKGLAVVLDGEGLLFLPPPSARGTGNTSDGEVRLRLVQATSGSHTRWKKISPNGSSNRSTGRKRGSHSSGWHKRSRPQHWRNLRSGSARTARSGTASSRTGNSRGGATHKPLAWHGREPLQARANYFLGNDHSKWRSNVPLYGMAEAENVEPGVDMTLYGNQQDLEYDLRLKSGADSSKLRLKFSPGSHPRLTANGDLIVDAAGGILRMKKPQVYEERRPVAAASAAIPVNPGGDSPGRKPVTGAYELEADGTIGFAIGPRDPSATLVIDPSLSVTYSTFLGGGGNETVSSMGLDSSGNVYIGGTTTDPSTFSELDATLGPGIGLNPTSTTAIEYFVAKINPNLSGSGSLVYLTFIGSSVSQAGALIAVDSGGDVAITGTTTSPDFPVTDGSARTSGSNDVTVSEIDPTGGTLLFSTLFGGSGAESQYAAGGVALDALGNIYISSDTSSTDLPVTAGVFQTTPAGGSDGFLAVFQPGATPSLTYCSYLGANASAEIGVGGVAIDAASNVYIAGYSSNLQNGFPVKNAYQSAYGGGLSDAFLMKIVPAGQGAADVIYATLLGGNGLDQALAVAVDDSVPANAYVTGTTQSTNFPTNGTVAAYQTALHPSAAANAFLSVIAPNPVTGVATLAYSTYLGGSENDSGLGLAVNAFNSVYVTGATRSPDFPWHDNLQPFNGTADAFVAKFDPSAAGAASLVYSTPLGGTAPPGLAVIASANAIAADQLEDVYVAGQTTAADFPTAVTTGGVMNGFQPLCASCQNFPAAADAFLVALRESSTPEPSVYFNSGGVDFPAAPIGTQNAPQPVAVHNAGEAPLAVSSLQLSGPNASDFSLIGPDACGGATIPAGGECSFEVGFVPSTTGAEAATVSITDNAPGNPQVLELIGAGQGPLISLSTTSLNFGSLPENTVSLSQTITVANVGNQALLLQSPGESGLDVAEFFLSGKDITCGPSLATGTSCSIGVVFTPKAIGTFHAQITLTDNSGGIANSTQVIALVGTATAPAPVATVAPYALAFGGIQVGTASGTQQVTLLNTGSIALNITGIALSGPNAGDFAMVSSSGQCAAGNSSLAVQSSCVVSVRFAPSATDSPGTKSAVLLITDNAAGSPQAVALSATATAPATVQVSPAMLHFSPQSDATPSAPQIVTLSNSGTSSLAIDGFSISGANAADFRQTNNCAPSLGSGAFCTVSVIFEPAFQVSASRSASLTITDNASGSPQSVALSGSATQAGVQIAPTSINFGAQQAGAASSPQTINVTNTGTGNLSFTSVAVSGGSDFVVGANTCSASQTPPGGNCTIQLTFNPACTNGAAARSASLSLANNVPGSPQSVALSGTATGDFCFASVPGVTVTPGQTAGYTLAVNSPTAYKGSVSLACANFPAASTCTVPTSVNVPSQFAVSVVTAANSFAPPQGANRAPRFPIRHIAPVAQILAGMVALLAWTFVWWWSAHACAPASANRTIAPWWRAAFLCALVASTALWIAACSSGGGADPPAATTSGTPAGSYALTITGTSTNTTSQVTLPLTVQ